jgi:hypothetical protein
VFSAVIIFETCQYQHLRLLLLLLKNNVIYSTRRMGPQRPNSHIALFWQRVVATPFGVDSSHSVSSPFSLSSSTRENWLLSVCRSKKNREQPLTSCHARGDDVAGCYWSHRSHVLLCLCSKTTLDQNIVYT